MYSATRSRLPLHYLFLIPETATPADQDAVAQAARELSSVGYVYVASTRERTMEDREDIRYMPLKEDSLPHFHSVTGVMVVRDHRLAHAAQETYPGAKITVIDPEARSRNMPGEWQLAPWRPVHSLRIRSFPRRTALVPDAA